MGYELGQVGLTNDYRFWPLFGLEYSGTSVIIFSRFPTRIFFPHRAVRWTVHAVMV